MKRPKYRPYINNLILIGLGLGYSGDISQFGHDQSTNILDGQLEDVADTMNIIAVSTFNSK